MTRTEHLKWCKERAIQEYDYYLKKEGIESANRNGLTSMMSDLGKHPETSSSILTMLIMTEMMNPKGRQGFINFINGFN